MSGGKTLTNLCTVRKRALKIAFHSEYYIAAVQGSLDFFIKYFRNKRKKNQTGEKRQGELWIHAGQLNGKLAQVDTIQRGQGAMCSIQNISRLLLHHPFRVRAQLGLQHL